MIISLTQHLFSYFVQVLDGSISKETVANGFTKCGLYPFDADAVDYGQLIKRPRMEDVIENDFVNSASTDFLEQFEENLDADVLLSFKNCTPEWNHQSENSSLFKFWKQIGGCSNPNANASIDKEIIIEEFPDNIIFEYLDAPYEDFDLVTVSYSNCYG